MEIIGDVNARVHIHTHKEGVRYVVMQIVFTCSAFDSGIQSTHITKFVALLQQGR